MLDGSPWRTDFNKEITLRWRAGDAVDSISAELMQPEKANVYTNILESPKPFSVSFNEKLFSHSRRCFFFQFQWTRRLAVCVF